MALTTNSQSIGGTVLGTCGISNGMASNTAPEFGIINIAGAAKYWQHSVMSCIAQKAVLAMRCLNFICMMHGFGMVITHVVVSIHGSLTVFIACKLPYTYCVGSFLLALCMYGRLGCFSRLSLMLSSVKLSSALWFALHLCSSFSLVCRFRLAPWQP